MALLYGSGLRISEALGLKRRDVPLPGKGDVIVVTGKGNKTRMVPVLFNVLQLVQDYVASVSAYNRSRRANIPRRARRPTESAHHPADHGAAARRARIARQRNPLMRCAILSRHTRGRVAATCARSRNCSDTRRCRPRRSTPGSTQTGCWTSTRRPTRARDRILSGSVTQLPLSSARSSVNRDHHFNGENCLP